MGLKVIHTFEKEVLLMGPKVTKEEHKQDSSTFSFIRAVLCVVVKWLKKGTCVIFYSYRLATGSNLMESVL